MGGSLTVACLCGFFFLALSSSKADTTNADATDIEERLSRLVIKVAKFLINKQCTCSKFLIVIIMGPDIRSAHVYGQFHI